METADQPLGKRKDALIDTLTDLYAADRLQMEDFENLVSQVHAADSETALKALVLSRTELQTQARPAARADEIVASMSTLRKRGRWLVSDRLAIKGHMSTVVLDLREYAYEPGFRLLVRLDLDMSTIKLIVPRAFAVTDHFESNSMSSIKNRPRLVGAPLGEIVLTGSLNMSTVKVRYRR
jgi:hypothetical protein